MIDTVRLFYKFPDIVSYNDCYAVINCLSREFSRKHCLHKGKRKAFTLRLLLRQWDC